MIKMYENWKTKRIISKLCEEFGYEVIFDKLSRRESLREKVLKCFNVNDLTELNEKLEEEGINIYMYYNEEKDMAVFCIVEGEIFIGFNGWMIMNDFRLNM